MYGYEITRKVEELTSGKIVLTYGALYPVLHKLESEGVLVTLANKLFDLTEGSGELPWPEKMFANNYLSWVMTDLNAMESNVRTLKQNVLRLVK